jgi:AAA+ ATPase superfamily predicted ATPase
MNLEFANRVAELKELDAAAKAGGLLVVFGRRRVGKTRLLAHWVAPRRALYSLAFEGAKEIQIDQVFQDVKAQLETNLVPKSWAEFFELIGLQRKSLILCLDEFPYLVASDPSLPSVIQRWLDHGQPKQCLLILAGSSTRMMNDLFLNRAAPLYNRARKLLHVKPMSYGAFCQACHLSPANMESFNRFSMAGGIPKYWEFVDPSKSAVELAEELFFGFAPYLDQEPTRILRDEGIAGLNAISLLETIGRGAEKPSEMAARMATRQTNLSRLLQQLLDTSILEREFPFGESARSTKRTLYRIHDPTLRFWFRVYSPHRTRWHRYKVEEKARLIHEHASTVFEDYCRSQHPDAARYWEGNIEFDFVRLEEPGRVIVTEVKWRLLSAAERSQIKGSLMEKSKKSALSNRYPSIDFEVLGAEVLADAFA